MAEPSTTSAEGKIIHETWRRCGDNTANARNVSTSEMWLFLRDAVEILDDDLNGYSPTEITADSDFTISPEPTAAIKKLLILKMIEIIRESEYHAARYNGTGIRIKSGLDSIDSTKMLDELRKSWEGAEKRYVDAKNKYNLGRLSPQFDDLYDVNVTGTIDVN